MVRQASLLVISQASRPTACDLISPYEHEITITEHRLFLATLACTHVSRKVLILYIFYR